MRKILLINAFLMFALTAMAGNDITQKTLQLAEFHSVCVNSGYTVYIKQHNKQEVNVEALSEIYAISEFIVENGVLHINVQPKVDNSGKSLWGKLDDIKIAPTMKVMISMKDIKDLKVNGSGKIITENSIASQDISLLVSGAGSIILDLKGQKIKSEVSGGGNIQIKGYADVSQLLLSGSGKINAFELEVEKSVAKLSGSGICEVFVSEELQGEVFGDGQLLVKGNTKALNSKVYGQGIVKRVH